MKKNNKKQTKGKSKVIITIEFIGKQAPLPTIPPTFYYFFFFLLLRRNISRLYELRGNP